MLGKWSRGKGQQSSSWHAGLRGPDAAIGWLHARGLACCLAAVAIVVSGCAYTGGVKEYIDNGFKVGPNYAKPVAPVATSWIDEYDDQIKSELPNYADWWTTFNDPVLNGLMEEVSRQNLTLKSAGLRVMQARYIRDITAGTIFPQQQQAVGSYQRSQYSDTIAAGLLPRNTDLFKVGFDSFWELDAWGKFRRAIESADASLDASVEDYDAILVSLLGETAIAYVDLRTAQERLRYAKANVEIQKGSLKLANLRFEAGAVSKLDSTQAETILANTQQLIPLFENQVRAANNSLCVLLGIPPRDLSDQLGDGSIPDLPADLVVGIPANLLRRRPDVRAAERRVAAQSAAIGVAAADLLPHLSVTGSVSLNANDFSDLFDSSSFGGVIAPGFTWDILNYGRLANNVNLQKSLFQDLAVQYQQTVLSANSEAETAINTFLKSKQRLVFVGQAVTASKQSVDLAQTQYKEGSVDYNRVFNLQTSLVSDQDNLATVRGEVARSVIATYKALGGGWQIRFGNRGGGGVSLEQVPVPPAEQAPSQEADNSAQQDSKQPTAGSEAGAADSPQAETPKSEPVGDNVDQQGKTGQPAGDVDNTKQQVSGKPASEAGDPVSDLPEVLVENL